MPLCHDPELIRPLLLSDEPGTHSIYNLAFGCAGVRARWIRVDDLNNPQAVILRGGGRHRRDMLYLYAANHRAAENVLAGMPKRWALEFAATPRRFVRSVRKFRKVNWTGPCYLYVLNPEDLVIFRKHRIGEMHDADIPFIVNYWPHGRSEAYLRGRIHAGPTCAIRVKGKLAAWALTHADGAMGILHVLEKYRGQGMARSITTELARRIMKWGLKPFLYIVRKNVASITLTESMGFKRYGEYCWFGQ